MSARSIPIYPANLANYEETLTFGRPKRPFWTPVAFFGGGVHILNCDTRSSEESISKPMRYTVYLFR